MFDVSSRRGILVIHLTTLNIYMLKEIEFYQAEISKIHKNLSISYNLKKMVKKDGIKIKKVINDIRHSIKTKS